MMSTIFSLTDNRPYLPSYSTTDNKVWAERVIDKDSTAWDIRQHSWSYGQKTIQALMRTVKQSSMPCQIADSEHFPMPSRQPLYRKIPNMLDRSLGPMKRRFSMTATCPWRRKMGPTTTTGLHAQPMDILSSIPSVVSRSHCPSDGSGHR
jgi:hypothetical protein